MTSFTVHCTHCDTAFPVDPDKVPEGGVRARCTSCEGIFFVARPLAVAPEPTESAVAPPEPEVAPPEPAVAPPGPDVAPLEIESAEEPLLPDEPPAEAAAVAEDVTEEIEDPGLITESVPHADDDVAFGAFDDEIELVDSPPTGTAAEEVGEVEVVEPMPDAVGDVAEEIAPDRADAPEGVEAPEAPDELEVEVALDEAVEVAETSPPELEQEIPAVPAGFQFGKRDPHEKARRLARVLVSDMITYNPDRHARALERGSLADDFDDEIEKSWQEYVDQVGAEMAESTPYWTDALNEVLAKGRKVF